MDGFKRPNRQKQPDISPLRPEITPGEKPPAELDGQVLPPIGMDAAETDMSLRPKRRKKWFFVLSAALLLAMAIVGGFLWYQTQLQPVDASNTSVQRVEIKEGASFGYVADRLEERGVIRSSLAFRLFASLQGKQSALKAGACNLTPADSASQVLEKITAGCHDFKVVTFYPGATLEPSLYAKTKARESNKEFKDLSIRGSLREAGFHDSEISDAFAARYESPLFASKPAGEGYEGYVFGETYYVDTGATAKDVLKTAFDYMHSIVTAEQLEQKFKSQGLNLYEGITLASIVERELDCEGKPTEERQARCYAYQQQIARVFYNRLDRGMSLGSDVTSIYASDKLNIASSVDVDSPYNTRRYTGLTPGPIATPGKLALRAVANPSEGDNLYFLAGDDGLIYFAKDEAGHQANIANHCKLYCGDL
jgi:UPF0755 protein